MKRSVVAASFFASLLALSLAASPAPAAGKGYKVVEVKDGGSVRGVVKIGLSADEKAAFALPKVRITKDGDKGCGGPEHDSERLVFDRETLGVGNAVVFLKEVAAGKEWPDAMKAEDRVATIDQKGCVYVPHVMWARPETQLVVVNSDAADHNIHGFKTPAGQNSLKETKFNISSEPGSTKDSNADAFLEDAGLYLVKCDIHPWMSAYVVIADHPYFAVTSDKAAGDLKPGAFKLDQVPPGSYTLVVWKEGMVEKPIESDGKVSAYNYSENVVIEKQVTVEAGKELDLGDITIPLQK